MLDTSLSPVFWGICPGARRQQAMDEYSDFSKIKASSMLLSRRLWSGGHEDSVLSAGLGGSETKHCGYWVL